jgi:hypothetical protein
MRGCLRDTDGDGKCHAHPTGCGDPAPEVIDPDWHGRVPLAWFCADGSRVALVKRAPCDGAWVDEIVLVDGAEPPWSFERTAGPFTARWLTGPTLEVVGDVATPDELRAWLAGRTPVRFRATPGEIVRVR